MLDHLILMLSLLGAGQVGTATVFGSSSWDRHNPCSRLACLHRDINDAKDVVIAHNTLPCGTKVWVFNLRTGRSTVAQVADRGPRHAYVDLSRRVARAIGHNGREDILLVALSTPPPKARKSRAGKPVMVAAPVEETWDAPHTMPARPALLRPAGDAPVAPLPPPLEVPVDPQDPPVGLAGPRPALELVEADPPSPEDPGVD